MAALDQEKFQPVLESDEWPRIFGFLKGSDHAARRPLAPAALDWYRKAHGDIWEDWSSEAPAGSDERSSASRLAVLCCGVPSEWQRVDWLFISHGFPFDDIASLEVAKIDQWVIQLLEAHWRNSDLVRQLVRHGVCEKPQHDAFFLGILQAPFKDSKYDYLKANPDAIEDIWRLLEIEGSGEASLAAADKYLGWNGGWSDALKQMSEEGILDRGRLLDLTLDVLARDFAQFRASWYSRFQLTLAPTDDEITARLDGYLTLLGSSIPPTVSFAIKMLKQIEKAKRLPYDELLQALQPVLQAKAKSTVRAALRFFANALKQQAVKPQQALIDIQPALISDHSDVQQDVLKLLKQNGGAKIPEVREALKNWTNCLVPSLRRDFSPLLDSDDGDHSPTESEAEVVLRAPAQALDPQRAIVPVADCDEWLQLAALVMQHPHDVVQLERLFGGIPLLASASSTELQQKSGPLLQMVRRELDRNGEPSTSVAAAACFVDALLGDGTIDDLRLPEESDRGENDWRRNLQRLRELASAAQQRCNLPVLSAPTHTPAWIDPLIHEQRIALWKAAGRKPPEMDLSFARARIPDAGPVVNASYSWAVSTFGSSSDLNRFEITRTPPLDIRESDSRYWLSRYEVLLDGVNGEDDPLPWLLSHRPNAPEPYLLLGAEQLSLGSVYFDSEGERGIRFIDFLADPIQPLEWLGSLVLLMGTSSGGQAIRTMTTDVLIDRLFYADAEFFDTMARELGGLLAYDLMKCGRIATCLKECAAASPRHARLVRDFVVDVIATAPKFPRDFLKLLEVLNECAHQYPFECAFSAEFQSGLERITTGGKTAKLAQSIRAMA